MEISQEQRELLASIDEAEKTLEGLNGDLAVIDREVDGMAGEIHKYQLLDDICASLDQLKELGVSELFWGKSIEASQSDAHLSRVRQRIAAFHEQTGSVQQSKQQIEKRIEKQLNEIGLLNDELDELLEQEERARYDYVVEREERVLPFRPMMMPWSETPEDKRRLGKSLGEVAVFALALTVLISLWTLPPPKKNEVVKVPERLVRLVQRQKPKPMPTPKVAEHKAKKTAERHHAQKPQKAEKKPTTTRPSPKRPKNQVARTSVQKTGILAFKKNFSDLLADNVNARLGSSARVSTRGKKAIGNSDRNLVMSEAKTMSGGINTAALSHSIGNGAGTHLEGVAFTRVKSDIGSGMGGGDRPLADGPGPSRTDEEIQIVFDRYKASLYRIYNRELRVDPTLKGKMVLRITIEPDGSVSFVKVESTDMDSPELSAQIVARVHLFNFGAKEGVAALTILYPIDFLPAT